MIKTLYGTEYNQLVARTHERGKYSWCEHRWTPKKHKKFAWNGLTHEEIPSILWICSKCGMSRDYHEHMEQKYSIGDK
jgi:hypothetical protein